jgi:hypothetical protein
VDGCWPTRLYAIGRLSLACTLYRGERGERAYDYVVQRRLELWLDAKWSRVEWFGEVRWHSQLRCEAKMAACDSLDAGASDSGHNPTGE